MLLILFEVTFNEQINQILNNVLPRKEKRESNL